MKTKFLNLQILIVFLSIATLSCSSDNSDNDNNNQNNNASEIMQLSNDTESGTWIITSFIDSGQDETNHFNGFSFTFNSNGTIVANDGTTTVNGTWSITDTSNSSDDDSYDDNDIDFNMSFSSPADFTELSDDWDIVTHTSSRIDLIDISGGNGGTDTLTFQKN